MKIELPTGDVIVENRFVYEFEKPVSGTRMFGPYENAEEASDAYQKLFGIWPQTLVDVIPYALDPRPTR